MMPHDLASQSQPASIEIDASRVEGRISPLLYGQFAEFMFENIKRLVAEGKPVEQAVAISFRLAGERPKGKKKA